METRPSGVVVRSGLWRSSRRSGSSGCAGRLLMRAALFVNRKVGGEVEAADAAAEFPLGVFVESEAETGHVDLGTGETRGTTGDFDKSLLIREAEVAEAEQGADEVEVLEFLEDGDNGEILGAADVDADVEVTRSEG